MKGKCQSCGKYAELDEDIDGKRVCENCWSHYGKLPGRKTRTLMADDIINRII